MTLHINDDFIFVTLCLQLMSLSINVNFTIPAELKSISALPLPKSISAKQSQNIFNFIEDYQTARLPENASGLQVWDVPSYRCVYAFKNKVRGGVSAVYMRPDFSTGTAIVPESDDVMPGSSAAGFGPKPLLDLLREYF